MSQLPCTTLQVCNLIIVARTLRALATGLRFTIRCCARKGKL